MNLLKITLSPIFLLFALILVATGNVFVPAAKITENESFSIVTDYLGTPTNAYKSDGTQIWERKLNSYGGKRAETGGANFVPFRFQGQYFDGETGLCYNRFRYYSAYEGMYISQDPIRLSGGISLYSYVCNINWKVDKFGLAVCQLSQEDKDKLHEMYGDEGMDNPHDHHIVREHAPSNWDEEHRNYILDSQKIISDAGIGLNDDIRNYTVAENGKGAHTKEAAKNVYEQLSRSDNVEATMKKMGEDMNKGKF